MLFWLQDEIKYRLLAERYQLKRIEKWEFSTPTTYLFTIRLDFHVRLGVMDTDWYRFEMDMETRTYRIYRTSTIEKVPDLTGTIDITFNK